MFGVLMGFILPFFAIKACYFFPITSFYISAFEPRIPFILYVIAIAALLVKNEYFLSINCFLESVLKSKKYILPAAIGILFSFPLINAWTSNKVGIQSHYSMIGGAIPYSDAACYYDGALSLIKDNKLDSFSCRRPINTAFLSFSLALFDLDIKSSIIFQAAVLALASYIATSYIISLGGIIPGLIFFAIIFAFGRLYVAISTSEALGLTLGLLSMPLLLEGARSKSKKLFTIGVFIFTCAMNARAGAMLIIPALALWGILNFNKTIKERIIILILISLSVFSAFAYSKALLYRYNSSSELHGNFSYVIYGITSGGRGWTAVHEDHGQNLTNAEIYRYAAENFRANPLNTIKGLFIGYSHGLRSIGWNFNKTLIEWDPMDQMSLWLASLHRTPEGLAKLLLCLFVFCPFLIQFIRHTRKQPLEGHFVLLIFAAAGFFSSLGFIAQDGGYRVFAASQPLLAAMAALSWKSSEMTSEFSTLFPKMPLYAAINCAIILLLSLAGPAFFANPFKNTPDIRANDNAYVLTIMGKNIPHIKLFDDNSLARSFSPKIRASDFLFSSRVPRVDNILSTIKPPQTLWLAKNISNNNNFPSFFYVIDNTNSAINDAAVFAEVKLTWLEEECFYRLDDIKIRNSVSDFSDTLSEN